MNKNYSELKNKIFKKIEEIEKDDPYGKPLFLLLEKVEELVKCDCCEESEKFQKLCKQLAYDYLVCKRRKYKDEYFVPYIEKDVEYKCKNPSNFPMDKSPYDKENLVDCLTAWTEKRETLSCGDIEFNYLQNLDATYLILGKDSTGQLEHKKTIDLLEAEKICKDEIRKYVNKESNDNPMGSENKARLDLFRYGISLEGVKTNRFLAQSCSRYLNECIDTSKNEDKIIPNPNPNIFLSNSFVFLSAKDMSRSIVPSKDMKLSMHNFIMPLIDIIKPQIVIQGGADAMLQTHKAIERLNKNILQIPSITFSYESKIYSKFSDRLNTIHNAFKEDSAGKENLLYRIIWENNDDKCTYFYPTRHPSAPEHFKDENNNNNDLVWSIIKKTETINC